MTQQHTFCKNRNNTTHFTVSRYRLGLNQIARSLQILCTLYLFNKIRKSCDKENLTMKSEGIFYQ